MNIRLRGQHPERGSVMFAALAVVLTITVLASCLLQISSITSREQSLSIDTKRAFYLAEAGLSEAWYGLKTGKSGAIGTAELPAAYGDGLLYVETERLDVGRVSLTSTGLVGSGRFTLSMVVERESASVGAMGFFADDDMVIGEGVGVDSYDSDDGIYEPPLVDELGEVIEGVIGGKAEDIPNSGSMSRMGSNGDITISGSAEAATTIAGDVQPGPSSSVIVGESVTISGSTAPASKPYSLPEIDVPVITSSGDMTVGARGSLSELPTGSVAYGLLKVPTGRVLTINGPTTLVVERLQLDAGGELVLNAALGPIQIYTTQELTLADGSNVTCLHETPANLSLQVSATELVDRDGDGELESAAMFRPTGDWLGTLYAPYSDVAVSAATEVFGAITAKSLDLEDGVQLHFDEALAALSAGEAGEFVVTAWRVVELPDVPLVTDKGDPVVKLLLKGVTAPLSKDAHEVVMFKIEYVDWSDVTQTWSGDEARFNWGDVKTIVEVAREGDGNFDTIF